YEDDPGAHLKTEFGFDVLEVAKERFAPDSYHEFIGFEVAKPLLERAFQDNYSIPLRIVYDDLDKAVGSYRYSVRAVIPKATKVAWALKEDRSEEHTSELQSPDHLVCRLLLEKKKTKNQPVTTKQQYDENQNE